MEGTRKRLDEAVEGFLVRVDLACAGDERYCGSLGELVAAAAAEAGLSVAELDAELLRRGIC